MVDLFECTYFNAHSGDHPVFCGDPVDRFTIWFGLVGNGIQYVMNQMITPVNAKSTLIKYIQLKPKAVQHRGVELLLSNLNR